ncbi:MAG: hypothetical protein ACOYJ2_02000 [Rickettsiales bacterium]
MTEKLQEKFPKRIVVMDTESMGLANYQADSAKDFGVYQISALKFDLFEDGHLRFVDHMDLMVEPDPEIIFKDPREGAKNRHRFYTDYDTLESGKESACFKAYEQAMFDPNVGLETHYFYELKNPQIQKIIAELPNGEREEEEYKYRSRFRPYSDHVAPENIRDFRTSIKDSFRRPAKNLSRRADGDFVEYTEDAEENQRLNDAQIFSGNKSNTLLVYENLKHQRDYYQQQGDTQKAEEIDVLRLEMLEELQQEPWRIEQIDETEGASRATGFKCVEDLRHKAETVNRDSFNGRPASYAEAAERFSSFCEGTEAMVGHNVMFDFSIMDRLFAKANQLVGENRFRFPFTQDRIIDSLPLSALSPERFGKRNSLDALIDDEPYADTPDVKLQMEQDIENIEGVGQETLKKCLGGKTRIGRLDPDKETRSKGGHDAIEDVFITAAVLERIAKERATKGKPPVVNAASAVQEALCGDAISEAPIIDPSAIRSRIPNNELQESIEHLCAFIPDTPYGTNEHDQRARKAYDFTIKMLRAMDAIDPTEPEKILHTNREENGVLVNLQKLIPSLGYIARGRQLFDSRYADIFSDAYLTKGNFPNLVIAQKTQREWADRVEGDLDNFVLSPYDFNASAPFLHWEDPQQLHQDLKIMHEFRHFITPYGSRVRYEAPPKGAESEIPWLSISEPAPKPLDNTSGEERKDSPRDKQAKAVHHNVHRIYNVLHNAYRDGTLGNEKEGDILRISADPVDHRLCVKIRHDALIKAHEMEPENPISLRGQRDEADQTIDYDDVNQDPDGAAPVDAGMQGPQSTTRNGLEHIPKTLVELLAQRPRQKS